MERSVADNEPNTLLQEGLRGPDSLSLQNYNVGKERTRQDHNFR